MTQDNTCYNNKKNKKKFKICWLVELFVFVLRNLYYLSSDKGPEFNNGLYNFGIGVYCLCKV